MCAPDPSLYTLLFSALSSLFGPIHPASLSAITDLVEALLIGQSLHPADLARTLPRLQTAHARQAQRRVRRSLGRSRLGSQALTPWLIRAALALVSDAEVSLVLDSTRCVTWEIFTLGVRWHGRVLPIAWAILPYPWPKRQFTSTVVDLLDRTMARWPAATLVIGHGLVVYPSHQTGPSDRARRAGREHQRVAHLTSKAQPGAPQSDRVWALLTTKATWLEVVRADSGRFATEGTYCDVKTWDWEAVASHETDAIHLDGLIGLASLGYLVQAAMGAAAGRATETDARTRQEQWSTTDRLSIFWRGRQVLRDPVHDWLPLVTTTLRTLTATWAPIASTSAPTRQPERRAA